MSTKQLTTNIFVSRCKIKHGDKYDYSLVNYTTCNKKVNIICKIHGNFLQSPNHHLNGSNCPKCVNRDIVDTNRFIEKSNIIHGNKYNYSKVEYINNYSHIIIICPIHGEFLQTPNSHVCKSGCPTCKTDKLIEINTKSDKYYIDKANLIHNFKYIYPEFPIKNKKIKVICPLHGLFEQLRITIFLEMDVQNVQIHIITILPSL